MSRNVTEKAKAKRVSISRRDLMRQASATAATGALMSAVKAAFPGGVFAQGAGPEVKKATSASSRSPTRRALFVAKEKGLLRQARHARRGGRQAGLLGRHARQPGAGRRGQRHRRRAHPDAHALPDLDRKGHPEQRTDADVHPGEAQPRRQAISVAKEYADLEVGIDASPFKAAFEKKKAAGKSAKAAMTFPGGTHDLWIRYWLAAGGIDPDKDV